MKGAIVIVVAALDASPLVCRLDELHVVVVPSFGRSKRPGLSENEIKLYLPSALATLRVTRATSTTAGIILSSPIIGVEPVEFLRADAAGH